MKKSLLFQNLAFNQYSEWAEIDMKIFQKACKLIREIQRTPFEGTGNPEPLKYHKSGLWSRRITLEHRIIYEVTDDKIIIYSCKGHYKKS
jgi:toxin YoeB